MDKTRLDEIILSYALKNKRLAMEITNSLSSEYFENEYEWLYDVIEKHFNDPRFKEVPTKDIVIEYLKKQYSDSVDEKTLLLDNVLKLSCEEQEFSWHLEKIKRRKNLKVQKSCVSNIIKISKEDCDEEHKIEKINEIIKKTSVNIDTIYRKESYDEGSLDQSAKERVKKYKEIEANPEIARGVLTGFSELDRITNGLHGGELLLIGGATGTGKSIVMHNMAVNAYLGAHSPLQDPPSPDQATGSNILYFSLEMPKSSQERRIDACMADVIANEIRDGRLNQADKEKYFRALRFQANYSKKFHIVDMPRGVTAREVELKYVEVCDKYNMKFDQVFVDYLGIMSPSTQQTSDWLELGIVAEELHELARTYKIPVVTATQLNRPKDPSKPMQSTDRIARSNMIPDNANIILQIACRGEDEYTRLDMPIYITKMRDGEKGSFILTKNFAKMKVLDLVQESFNEELDDIDL